MKKLILLLATASLAAGAHAAPAKRTDHHPVGAREASIPFVNYRGVINDFEADGDEALWLQDNRRRWYHARLIGPCTDLPFAQAIGVDVRGTNRLDRFGTLIVRGQRCAISSLVASAPPPRKERHAKRRG